MPVVEKGEKYRGRAEGVRRRKGKERGGEAGRLRVQQEDEGAWRQHWSKESC